MQDWVENIVSINRVTHDTHADGDSTLNEEPNRNQEGKHGKELIPNAPQVMKPSNYPLTALFAISNI